jgi:hypothetical protein
MTTMMEVLHARAIAICAIAIDSAMSESAQPAGWLLGMRAFAAAPSPEPRSQALRCAEILLWRPGGRGSARGRDAAARVFALSGVPGGRAGALLLPLIARASRQRPLHPKFDQSALPCAPEETLMTVIHRLVAVAAFAIAGSLSAHAEPASETAATQTAPIPALHCEFKAVSACSPDGACKPGKDMAGMPLPLKVTVDFENTVVSAVDDSGFPHMDNFDAAADSGSAHRSWHRWRLRLANGDP